MPARKDAAKVEGRARPRVTHDAILDCAEQVFAERGYRATNLTHVASRLGVTRQALYYYYPRKHDILLGLFRRMMTALQTGVDSILATNPAPADRFAMLLENHARIVAKHIDLITILLCETAEFPEDFGPEVRAERTKYNKRLIKAYRDGVKAGVHRDVDPTISVNVLVGAINCMFRWYRPTGAYPPEKIASYVTALLCDGFATGGWTGSALTRSAIGA